MIKLPKALLFGKAIRKQEKEGWRTGMSATSARRVVTFLPPPRISATNSIGDGLGRSGENALPIIVDGVQESSRALSRKSAAEPTTYKSYPSPKHSALTPCSSPLHRQLENSSSPRPPSLFQLGDHVDDYRPPSPPTSDPAVIAGCASISNQGSYQVCKIG
jgi:hypothetical protein